MNEDVKSENLRIHSRADELIACLEGEIAKRDARIVELESGQSADMFLTLTGEITQLRAELAALKAQGVVMQASNFEASNGEYRNPGYEGQFDGETVEQAEARRHWATTATDLATARLNAAPVQQVSVPDVSAMARILADRSADTCNVNREDNWAIYGRDYIDDVVAMLAAQAAPAADAGMVEALALCVKSLDQLLPYLGKVPADIGLLNDALMAARPALAAHRSTGVA